MNRVVRLAAPGGLDRIRLQPDDAARAPGPGEIQVAIRASSLNAHDYMVATGALPVADGRILLSDAAGAVIAAGEGAGYAVGDAVLATFFPKWPAGRMRGDTFRHVPGDGIDGYARDIVTAPATAFTPQPAGLTPLEAATLPCAGLTAWRALAAGGLRAGDTVLVQGSGGVSVFALQFARAAGAAVIATSSSDAKLERLKALGADHAINYRTTPGWGDAARRLTGGVDHVVEIGGAGTLDQSILACRNGGHIALIGVLAGGAGSIQTARLMAKQIRLTGITVGSTSDQLDMIRAIETCGIRPVLDRTFALEDMADAFRFQATGAHFGKIAIDFAA